ncbi:MAG: hypothetical protein AABY88_06640, partial [Pseudomonadota bacterium]
NDEVGQARFIQVEIPFGKRDIEVFMAPIKRQALTALRSQGFIEFAHPARDVEDPPGLREGAMGKMYLAYLRDPSGNKICVLKRMG